MGEKVISESITPHIPFLGPAFSISLEDWMTNGLGSNTPYGKYPLPSDGDDFHEWDDLLYGCLCTTQ